MGAVGDRLSLLLVCRQCCVGGVMLPLGGVSMSRWTAY